MRIVWIAPFSGWAFVPLLPFMDRVTRTVLLATLALDAPGCTLELCLNLDSSVEDVASSEDPIIGGQVDGTHRATVALLSTQPDGGRALCSGTVIAKRDDLGYVLTAAHCVGGTMDAIYDATDWYDCAPGGDLQGCNAAYTPVAVHVHPQYGTGSHAADFAIVVFSGATADTVVVPVAGAEDDLFSGAPLELSGYGRTYAGPAQTGVFNHERHSVEVSLASLLPDWIRIDGSTGKTACFGDSGGPAYATVNGALRVVGVASNGDATCEHAANYGRVSYVYDSFVAPIIGPPDTPGEGGQSASGGAAASGGQSAGGASAGGASAGGASAGGASAGGASAGGGSAGGSDATGTGGMNVGGTAASGGSCAEDAGGGAGTTSAGSETDASGGSGVGSDTNCSPVTLGCSVSSPLPSGSAGGFGLLLGLAALGVARRRGAMPSSGHVHCKSAVDGKHRIDRGTGRSARQ